ncbi:hypothetical protein QBC37DRAFT_64704 [Rhypophila decipiens]|uniref:Uncharacterized protein n=1 Tax=Rhypophila decipiens TaxID=261697 RepID=A0AAN6XY56_9PEZI|nr:hypothetical protein QBC37DRAFT_64704 [Rhypophila decipiens]
MRFESTAEHDIWGDCADAIDCQGDNRSVTTDDLPTGLLTPTSTITSGAGYRSFTTGATVDCSGLASLSSHRSESESDDLASTASSHTSEPRSRRSRNHDRRRPRTSNASTRDTASENNLEPRPRTFQRNLCLLGLIPVGLFLLVAVAGYIVSTWAESNNNTKSNEAIDCFLSSQEDWMNVNDLVTKYDYLPTVVKQGESEMVGLMVAIKHSHLRGRDRLVSQMDRFATVSSSISSHANKWNALAGSNIDRVQNMNYHALRALEAVQRSSSWPVIPAPSPGESGIISHIQSAAHGITSAMADAHKQRVTRLHEVIGHEADQIADGLGQLRVTGTQLVGEFRQAVFIMQNIADIAHNEAFIADGDRDELKTSFWQWFGLYSESIANLGTHIEYLQGMAGHIMVGHNAMSEILTEIEGLDESFKILQTALKEANFEKSEYTAQQLDRIQSSIRRLDGMRQSSRARAQAGRYETVRRRIEGF